MNKKGYLATRWFFLLIAVVCLVSLFLPTNLEITPEQSFSPYVIEINVTSLLKTSGVTLYPSFGGGDSATFTVSDFDVSAVLHYPKYYIGLAIALVLACVGLVLSSKSEGENE